jgi:23S rRNA pseudouridine1911/1915/1917 synthase
MEPEIIYKDANILGVVKPAGLLMHTLPNAKGPEPTLADWLKERFPEIAKVGDEPDLRPGLVHRLDRHTSGIVVVARTQAAFAKIKSLFQSREIQKTYLALVFGTPKKERGTIDLPIGIISGSTKRSVRSEKMRKEATTDYVTLAAFDGYSLLAVRPRTGRTHQIRVHLASEGHPIVGDPLYTKRKVPFAKRLMLHAYALELPLENRRLRLEAQPGEDFLKVLRDAGASEDIITGLPQVIHKNAL